MDGKGHAPSHRPRRRPMSRGFSDEIHSRAEVGGRPAEAGRQGDRLPGILHHAESQENVSETSGFLGGEVQGRRGGCHRERQRHEPVHEEADRKGGTGMHRRLLHHPREMEEDAWIRLVYATNGFELLKIGMIISQALSNIASCL